MNLNRKFAQTFKQAGRKKKKTAPAVEDTNAEVYENAHMTEPLQTSNSGYDTVRKARIRTRPNQRKPKVRQGIVSVTESEEDDSEDLEIEILSYSQHKHGCCSCCCCCKYFFLILLTRVLII